MMLLGTVQGKMQQHAAPCHKVSFAGVSPSVHVKLPGTYVWNNVEASARTIGVHMYSNIAIIMYSPRNSCPPVFVGDFNFLAHCAFNMKIVKFYTNSSKVQVYRGEAHRVRCTVEHTNPACNTLPARLILAARRRG